MTCCMDADCMHRLAGRPARLRPGHHSSARTASPISFAPSMDSTALTRQRWIAQTHAAARRKAGE
eukprot:COSAG01_NODE_7461_length_3203_cov_2.029317_3_plen_65_part_00